MGKKIMETKTLKLDNFISKHYTHTPITLHHKIIS